MSRLLHDTCGAGEGNRNTFTPSAFSLDRAVLCLNCANVSNSIGETCYVCAHKGLLSLARALDTPKPSCEGCGTETAKSWAEVCAVRCAWPPEKRNAGKKTLLLEAWQRGDQRDWKTRLLCGKCAKAALKTFLSTSTSNPVSPEKVGTP